LMLALATSPSSQVSTNNVQDSIQPKLLHQTSEENVQYEKELRLNILRNDNEVSKDSLPCEVPMNGIHNIAVGDFGLKATVPTSAEYPDSLGLTRATNVGVTLTDGSDGIITSDDKRGSLMYAASKVAHHSDKPACNDHDLVLQPSDHEGPILCHDVDPSDCSVDRDGQPTLCHGYSTDRSNDYDGQITPCTVDQTGRSDDQDVQLTLCHVEPSDRFSNLDEQAMPCHVDPTDRSYDRNDKLTLCYIDATDHSDDQDGQPTLRHVDQVVMVTRLPAAPQTLMVDQANHSEDLHVETVDGVDQTDRSNDGQLTLCHVDQVVMVTRLFATPHTLMVDQIDHFEDLDGKALDRVDQTDRSNDGQLTLCDVDQMVNMARLPATPHIITLDQTDQS